jgi:hypothetical protein
MTAFGSRALRMALALVVSVLLVTPTVGAASAQTQPWWRINYETVPANLPPEGEGQIVIVLSNLSDVPIDGATSAINASIKLPPGLTATRLSAAPMGNVATQCSLATLSCSSKGVVNPYERTPIFLRVKVKEPSDTVASLPVEARVEGGGAATVTRAHPVTVSGEPARYGVEDYELASFNADGTQNTQAGAHPFEFTTTLTLNQKVFPEGVRQPLELPKDLSFRLPAGLVGNPNAAKQCTMANFFALVKETNLCSPSSVVGVATVIASEPKQVPLFSKTVPVFNLVPNQGEPARFGFEVIGKIPIVIDTSVRSGQDYGVNVTVQNATEAGALLSSQVTFWGVPGDPRHNNARGWECVAGGAFAAQTGKTCPDTASESSQPFLTLPTSCAADPQAEQVVFPMQTDSWAHPGSVLEEEYAWMNEKDQLLGFQGCDQLPFSPSIHVVPEQHSASTPTGLSMDVQVPQQTTLEADKPAEADVRDTTVTLPRGVQLSPSAANGLEGCSEQQAGFEGFDQATQTQRFNTQAVACPDGSKLGTVHIKTPLLSHELEGALYLASPAPNSETNKNPFNSLVALYLVAEDPVSGVLVKLAGEGQIDEGTLQISTTFKNTPQVPFEDLRLDLFGGPKGSVSTPPVCGSYATSAVFTPWSGSGPVSPPGEDFLISSGVGGSGCPGGVLAFAPGFTAYSESTQAGSFTGFQLELSRPDGDQALAGVSMHLPSGVAALLSSVELCSDAQAAASACPAASEVGHATAIAGLGSEPYVQEGGRVFITEGYGDAPFGLEIVTPAKAGPFDLGYVTVRSKLYVDPNDASVTIVSDPLPTQIRGIPLQLKRVSVTVDRAGFEFNPTSCEPMKIDGTITGAGGTSAGVSSPFQVRNCEALPFSPEFTASAVGQGSKADGTTFAVTVRSGGVGPNGVVQAGIAKVQLQLPKQLSSRLPTLQKACVDSVFNANPATCDEGSVIGYATIHTPVLKNPLTGPAYLVSHGGAAFPDVEFVLQGEGIKLVLDGQTDIKGELTYSRFESTPDAPFTVFETVLPAGPHGVLTPNVAESKKFSLCGETLEMPTTMIAQNGARIEQETKVQVTGCAEVRSAKVTRLTLRQKLKNALSACRHRYKHAKSKRATCERDAHARYTRQALAACRHKHKRAEKKRQACERVARRRFAAHSSRAHGASRSVSRGKGATG